jgi:hypothetical protein
MSYINIIGRDMYINGVPVNTGVAQVNDGTEEKIKSFATLPRGWDYGRGGPIPEKTLREARAWNAILRENGLDDIDAFPGGDNEVVVAGSLGDYYVEAIVENDGKVSIAIDYKRKQTGYFPNLSPDDAEQIVKSLVREIWSASVYFTPISTIQSNVSLLELPSVTLTEGFLLWIGNVSAGRETLLLNTYANTISATQVSLESHQFSGNLTRTPFLPGIWSNKLRRSREISATTM